MNIYGETNARQVRNHIIAKPKLGKLVGFRRLAEVVIRGPERIYVRRSDKEDYENLDLLVRIILRASDRVSSWAIYRQGQSWQTVELESMKGYVLRATTWDIKTAIVNQEWEYRPTPTTSTVTLYIRNEYPSIVTKSQELDLLLLSGIHLEPRPDNSHSGWITVEVLRPFTKARIELAWDSTMQNPTFEGAIFALVESIENNLNAEKSVGSYKVEEIELVYQEPSQNALEFLSQMG